MKYLTLLSACLLAAWLIYLVLHLNERNAKETSFYIHYQRPYGECARLVTIKSDGAISKFPTVIVQQPDDIKSEHVWFTDRKGNRLDSDPIDFVEGQRAWWVTLKK